MAIQYYLIVAVVLAILLAIYFAYLKNPTVRGKEGENKVKRAIGETIESIQYVINNLTVYNNGNTSQIDHIVINTHGVFVIETKNYSGEIYGQETQREWTQVLAYGKVKNKFYNPVKQNATHVYYVRNIVGDLPIYSLIVFVQNNTSHINAKGVIPLSKLKKVLSANSGDNGYDTILTVEQMKTAYQKLLTQKVDISTREHVQNIRSQQNKVKNNICPRCNGQLVFRIGKYGSFWGCSNYPNCKFTKKD